MVSVHGNRRAGQKLSRELDDHATSVKVQMSADLVGHFKFTGSKIMLTLSWSTKSRKIQVQGQGGILDHAPQQLSQLTEVHCDLCETGQVKPPLRGSESLQTKGSTFTTNEPKPMYVPGDGEFAASDHSWRRDTVREMA